MVADDRSAGAPPLTPRSIEAAGPGEYRDGAAPGLRLRVTPQGARVFRWAVRRNGKIAWLTLGAWSKKPKPGHVTLAEVHLQLERFKEAHKAGRLEALLDELRPRAKTSPPAVGDATTVRLVSADFLALLDRERRRPEQARRIFDVDVLPTLGDLSIAEVTSKDVRAVIEAIVARGSPVAAGATLALVRQFFDFAVDRGDIDASPAGRFRKAKALGARKAEVSRRFLSPDELVAFLKALDAFKGVTPTVKHGLRLLLLLGVRSGELLRAEWSQVDLEASTLTVPPEHQKLTKERERRARPWVVPLPPTAVAILKELKVFADALGSRYVMASLHGDGEALTEKALNHAMRRLFTGDQPPLRFEGERPTPHDLRRTVRTHVEETLGVPEAIAERLLNHVRGGVVDTYARGDFVAQRREALTAWDAYVARLVAGEGATVVPMPAKVARS